MCQVTFIGHGSIAVVPGATILDAARQLGLPLSAPCGGSGKCGKCKVIANGQEVLACKYRVFDDITVSLPPQEKQSVLTSGMLPSVQPDPVYPGYLAAIDIGTTTVVCSLLSPAGQELMQLMKNMDKDTLSKMMQQAASGNFTGLSDSLSPFLGSEKVQTLLRQMEEK